MEGNTNTLLVQTTSEITNALSEEAIQTQNCSGQNIIALIIQAVREKYGWSIASFEVCPYMILAMPKLDTKTCLHETFSNTKHWDNDETDDEVGMLVDQHVAAVNCPELNSYIATMKILFI